jgi:hypothetical protein
MKSKCSVRKETALYDHLKKFSVQKIKHQIPPLLSLTNA